MKIDVKENTSRKKKGIFLCGISIFLMLFTIVYNIFSIEILQQIFFPHFYYSVFNSPYFNVKLAVKIVLAVVVIAVLIFNLRKICYSKVKKAYFCASGAAYAVYVISCLVVIGIVLGSGNFAFKESALDKVISSEMTADGNKYLKTEGDMLIYPFDEDKLQDYTWDDMPFEERKSSVEMYFNTAPNTVVSAEGEYNAEEKAFYFKVPELGKNYNFAAGTIGIENNIDGQSWLMNTFKIGKVPESVYEKIFGTYDNLNEFYLNYSFLFKFNFLISIALFVLARVLIVFGSNYIDEVSLKVTAYDEKSDSE